LDKQWGWRPAPNYNFIGTKEDASGNSYPVVIHIDENGFRTFGDLKSNKKKVLVLGDSYTHAVDVSDDKTYYSLLGQMMPIEVFAFGCGGYGTLQEFMVLDKYIELIHPDAIVLQQTGNDFINNDYDLEVRSFNNNNGLRRPYLVENNKIVYRLPKSFPGLWQFSNQYSRLSYFFLTRFDRIYSAPSGENSIEREIEKIGAEFPPFQSSIGITDRIVQKIRTRVPKHVEIYAFEISALSPYYREFQNISARHDIEFIDGIPQAILVAEGKGIVTKAKDKNHWNEAGHQIAAKILNEYFQDHWK